MSTRIDHIQLAFGRDLAFKLKRILTGLGLPITKEEEDPEGEWGFWFFAEILQITWLKGAVIGTPHIAFEFSGIEIETAVQQVNDQVNSAHLEITEVEHISCSKQILYFKLYSTVPFAIEVITTPTVPEAANRKGE